MPLGILSPDRVPTFAVGQGLRPNEADADLKSTKKRLVFDFRRKNQEAVRATPFGKLPRVILGSPGLTTGVNVHPQSMGDLT